MQYKDLLKLKHKPAIQAEEIGVKSIRLPNGQPLPPSYQDFCLELGFGRLFDIFEVYVPLQDKDAPQSLQHNLPKMKMMFDDYLHPFLDSPREPEEAALLEHAVPFARSDEGQYLYWDLRNPLENGEYPIYYAYFPMQITGTLAGNSIPELIQNMTGEHSRYILIFNPRPLKAVFVAYRDIDLAPAEALTIKDYQSVFKKKFLQTPFKDLVAFSKSIAEQSYREYEQCFAQKKRVEQGVTCEKALAFLNRILADPTSYAHGDMDRHQKELSAANKILARKRKSYDHIDEALLNVGSQLLNTIYLLKTRDLIYLEGMILTMLHRLAAEIEFYEPGKYATHPRFISETRKWLDLLAHG